MNESTGVAAVGPAVVEPLRRLPADEAIPGWVWHTDAMTVALADRDIGAAFRLLGQLGLSQRRLAARTGQRQSEISEITAGRRVAAYDLLARISDRLGIPPGLMGLAHQQPSAAPDAAASVVRTLLVRQCERCTSEPVVGVWTGLEVRLLREAMRRTVRDFAARLGVSDRMVSKWEAGSGQVRPAPVNQAVLDTALRLADRHVRRRFALAQLEAAPSTVAGRAEPDAGLGRDRPALIRIPGHARSGAVDSLSMKE